MSRKASQLLASATALAVTIALIPATGALASDVASQDPIDTISSIAPEIAAQTSTSEKTAVEDVSGEISVDVSIEPEVGTLSAESEKDDEGGSSTETSFVVNYANEALGDDRGFTTLSTDDPSVTAAVQPTASGVRVLTVISDSNAPKKYSYSFDVPESTRLVEDPVIGYILESDEGTHGALGRPWAVDAGQNPVPTSYSWEGSTLTQHVDLSNPDIEYPVVADPTWSYLFAFITHKGALKVEKMLKSCFNCYFPVSGAPRNFPRLKSILPLTVGPMKFECIMGATSKKDGYFGWRFVSTARHVYFAGSLIQFSIRKYRYNRNANYWSLVVGAFIVNPLMNNPVTHAGAKAEWARFAGNLKAG